MTIQQFLLLTDSMQCKIFNSMAIKIRERMDGAYSYYLYRLDSFYLEAKFEIQSGQIQRIHSFTMSQPLSKISNPNASNLKLTTENL